MSSTTTILMPRTDALLLVETWETPELQQAHCQTEVFAKLQELKAQYCDNVTFDKFNY